MCIKNGLERTMPPEKRQQGCISSKDFKVLLIDFELYFKIKEVNNDSKSNTCEQLVPRINNTVNGAYKGANILNWLLSQSTIPIKGGIHDSVEEIRQQWTLFSNISTRFGNWEWIMEGLEFGKREIVQLVFSDDQMK